MAPVASPTKTMDFTNVCSQVTDFLFVGGASVASQRDVLEQHGITHVINCAATVTPNYFPHVFDYYRLRLRDHATQDIHQHFYSIFQFIDMARSRHGKVFIHCVKGISRSPAMAIAYLMAREQLGLYPALELVRSSRPVIDPNAGFIFQLNEWDSLRRLHTKQPITLFRVDMSRGDVDGVPDVPLPDYPLIIGPVQADHLVASSPAQDYSVVNYVSIEPRDGHESFAPDAPFPPSLHIHFRTSNHIDLQFDVNLKRDLFAPDTFVWAHEGPELALLKSHKPHHIAYEGKLPQGYIRLTMFEAHKFHATVKLHDKIVVVDPVEQHKVAHQLDSPVTGLVAYTMPLAAATLSEDHHHRHLTTTYGRMTACTWTARQITVGVASDAGFTSEHGGAAQTQSYLIAVYNSINGLYDDQVGVHLTIGAFLIQTAPGGPAWNVEPQTCGPMVDMNIQLNAVKSSTMGYNTGVSIDAGAMTWVIVGHEIGHNFGADHTFAEGGIMSYDWNSPVKFYDNGQVCAFVQSVLDKCLKPDTWHVLPPTHKFNAPPIHNTCPHGPTYDDIEANVDSPTDSDDSKPNDNISSFHDNAPDHHTKLGSVRLLDGKHVP
ncbi:hypothetical protein DYB32_005942 [Aphanomyces invadans]|uniref:Uncharacterized protein n=1 Tax=Aphanomyces invadans TaxID=157072 RepID=A0A3R6YXD3_9STRA|nr:hypothetical protein DYB32_005942 [Aphanomyces invadans]